MPSDGFPLWPNGFIIVLFASRGATNTFRQPEPARTSALDRLAVAISSGNHFWTSYVSLSAKGKMTP